MRFSAPSRSVSAWSSKVRESNDPAQIKSAMDAFSQATYAIFGKVYQQQNPQGGITTVEAPLHVSNVMLVCPNCKEATRTSKRVNEQGKKVRVCKKCGKDIDK